MSEKMIQIKNLNYKYPDGTLGLSEIELEILKGESWGLIGPNGAGKSTFLQHLNGILVGEGNILIDGLNVCEKNLRSIRSLVGLVFQDPDNQLFMPTVFEDVAFGPENMGLEKVAINEAVNSALEKVDMTYASARSSHHLSFGERKRASIATVLSMNPSILALDEPTSNMDPRHRRELIDFLNRTPLTKIIATHDLKLVQETCTKVALLECGRLVVTGLVNDLLEDHALLGLHGLE